MSVGEDIRSRTSTMKTLAFFLSLLICMAVCQDEQDVSNLTVQHLQRLAYNSGVILADVKRIVQEKEEREDKLQEMIDNVDTVKKAVDNSTESFNEKNEVLEQMVAGVKNAMENSTAILNVKTEALERSLLSIHNKMNAILCTTVPNNTNQGGILFIF